MAGAGFKDFAVGEVLTASDVDTYLMQQTVMRFADAGARGSALGTATGTAVPLAEGMVTYLDDADAVEFYDGSGWNQVGKNLQVVVATDATDRSTTSSTFVSATLSASITPRASGNTVFVIWQSRKSVTRTSADNNQFSLRVTVGGTPVTGMESLTTRHGISGSNATFTQIDSSAVVGAYTTVGTSAVTFQTEFSVTLGTLSLTNATSTGVLTLIEVPA